MAGLEESRRKGDDESSSLRHECSTLEGALKKAEQEKSSRDAQIKSLHEEVARMDDQGVRAAKERKSLEEQQKKTSELLIAEEDKVNQINRLKTKLEQNVDQVQLHFYRILICGF